MQDFSEKVQVAHNEKLGRHLLANIDIEPGETILEERPLLVAPHWECSQMKCAQCLQESYIMCRKCGVFPLCMDCTTHAAYECDFFSAEHAGVKLSKNLLVENYAICGILKLLLLMEQQTAACQELNAMPVELADYRDTEMWQEHEEQIVAPLLATGLADVLSNVQLTNDLAHALCVRIDTHAFEVTARDGDTLKGIYVFGAKLPHHCVPNTVVAFDEDFSMKLYAAVPIHAGEIIYNSYANPMMGTSQRQHQLRMNRRLECVCTRCQDPTELGTHMSSLRCNQCNSDEAYAICDLRECGDWVCQICQGRQKASDVHELLAEIGEAMVNANGELYIYEELLEKYTPRLHPNHFLILDIKQNIATILRAELFLNSMHNPAKKLLMRRVQLCEELLPVARSVVPGISKLHAMALYEYLISLLELSELEFRANDISKEAYSRKLETAKGLAVQAFELLLYEPPKSAEGYLAQRILMEQKRIDEELKKLTAK